METIVCAKSLHRLFIKWHVEAFGQVADSLQRDIVDHFCNSRNIFIGYANEIIEESVSDDSLMILPITIEHVL